jgi:hypothetical protein
VAFIWMALGAVLLACTAVLFARALAICGPARLFAATLVIAATLVVFESIVLSLVHALTAAWLLAGQALWLLLALCLRRPRVDGRARRALGARPWASALHRLPGAIRAHPLVALLLIALVASLALQAFLAVAVAPNEPDSLGYHLPRAAFWLQQHSALQYHAGELNDPEAVAPPNAELLIAWTMALSRSDSFAQLVQWLSLLGVLACIVAACRMTGLTRAQSLFAACLFGLMPEVLLESATAQNDLVATFFLTAMLLFAAIGIRDSSRGALLVAALAAGLAVGTKLYAVFVLPGALALLLALGYRHRPQRSLLAFGAVATALATVALGSFNYVQNERNTHTLTGYSGTPEGDFVRTSPPADAARTGWNLLDAPGLPQPDWVSDPAERLAGSLFKSVRGSSFTVPSPAIREESNEDESAYGLVGLLLLVPLVLMALVRPRAPWWQRLLALAGLSWFVASALTLGYSPEGARYLMPAFAVSAPLLGLLARRVAWSLIAVALALATLPGTLLHDVYKPLLASEGTPSVLSMDRLRQQTIDDSVAPLRQPVRSLRRLVAPHAPLGFLNQDALMEYLLFGEPLARRLVALDPGEITPQRIREQHLSGVFIGFRNQPPCVGRLCLTHTAGLRFTALGPDSYLVTAS